MKLRGGGTNDLNRPRRVITGRVYEKFKPIFEWRQEDDHDNLLVYLLGFRKEFIKVTTENPNILRIRGECLVSGNKWNRFREDFTIPETCEKSKIRAKFDGGILSITMPKKMTNAPTTTFPQQPSSMTSDNTNPNNQEKIEHKQSDRIKENEPSSEKIIKTKTSMDSKMKDKLERCKMVVKMLAIGGMNDGRMVAVNMVAMVLLVAVSWGLCFILHWNLK
ncbi:unnamed protein product [Lactuca saligna]|uniref:SHSP domain-containing protein n=1 Tax=Lactuca saligna TaxID=75948 RepID=A0AA35V909_LACSI|nr:unnamed protein product [Lactuca saligna]